MLLPFCEYEVTFKEKIVYFAHCKEGFHFPRLRTMAYSCPADLGSHLKSACCEWDTFLCLHSVSLTVPSCASFTLVSRSGHTCLRNIHPFTHKEQCLRQGSFALQKPLLQFLLCAVADSSTGSACHCTSLAMGMRVEMCTVG